MSKQGRVIGIDLGTTNSVVAGMEGGQAAVVAQEEGGRTPPAPLSLRARGTGTAGGGCAAAGGARRAAAQVFRRVGAAEGPEHAEVTAILASICRVVEWEGLGAPTDKSYAECGAKFRELDDDGSGELEEEEIGKLAHVRPPPPADDFLSLTWFAHTAGVLRSRGWGRS